MLKLICWNVVLVFFIKLLVFFDLLGYLSRSQEALFLVEIKIFYGFSPQYLRPA